MRNSNTTVSPTEFSTLLVSTTYGPAQQSNARALQRITLIAYCYILPIICVIGIIGNITNLITLASRRLRAVSFMYLRALAVADLLCMIFVLFFVSGEIIQIAGVPLNQYRLYGFYQAHLMLSLINWALATGVLIVVTLSLDRFVSIIFPMHFRRWNAPNRAITIIISTFAISGILHIPYAFGRYAIGEKTNSQGIRIYAPVDSEASKTVQWQVYKWTREGLLRFSPIVILSVLNVQIMYAFRRRQKLFARLKNRKQRSSSSKDDTLIYILGGIVAMFFICNIPAALNLLFINETIKQRVDYQIFRAIANLLEITNHASQFYVFCACSADYRVTFLRKFAFCSSRFNQKNNQRIKSDSLTPFPTVTRQPSVSVSYNQYDADSGAPPTNGNSADHRFTSNLSLSHTSNKVRNGENTLLIGVKQTCINRSFTFTENKYDVNL